MPVPTETLRNIRKLNVVFAVSAVALLLSTFWMAVGEDTSQPWREFQRKALVWNATMTGAELTALQNNDDLNRQIKGIDQEVSELDAKLPHDQIKQLQAELAKLQNDKNAKTLPLATSKGEVNPKIQQIERSVLESGENSAKTKELRAQMKKIQADYDQKFTEMVGIDENIARINAEISRQQETQTKLQKKRDDLTRSRNTLSESLAKLDPQGTWWRAWVKLGQQIRNAPLSNWFNPSEKVEQVVIPDVRTDLKFINVTSIDRCNSCHVNIDNPRYEPATLTAFIERQLASSEGQNINVIDKPVVMLGFWTNAAAALEESGAAEQLKKIQATTLNEVNAVRETRGVAKVDAGGLMAEMEALATTSYKDAAGQPIPPAVSYAPLQHFYGDVRELLRSHLGPAAFKQLEDMHRHELIAAYNKVRSEHGLPELSDSPVLWGHPNMELYAEAESKHPMKTVGCTVCHEGSGQETEFEHTAHTPRKMWVDAQTGAPVAEFLTREGKSAKPQAAQAREGATVVLVSNTAMSEEHAASGGGGAGYSHDDLPVGPVHESHLTSIAYADPATGKDRKAVPQANYWNKSYGWEEVHYMAWEKPMHELDFVESSCNRCHTEVFDIKNEAPRLMEGRLLFSQMGCVNCHAVDSLKDDLDIKKVGPSLVNVGHKLSGPMMASWIWSPKAFRPTTRMPHFFMLENSSSPVDILRTRTEVTAITYYLLNTPPVVAAAKTPGASGSAATPLHRPYNPEPPPAKPGNAKHGKELFKSVGCLACHTNLGEYGEKWITDDLVKRTGAAESDAKKQFAAMSYNDRHWYTLEHLNGKLERYAPELSAEGTKLKAGRTQEQARAWVYDWVRNPKHYSDYTTMPSFRLSEDEANDLAAYLLTLERTDYKPDSFGYDADNKPTRLDDHTKKMLTELVAQLKAPQSTLELARKESTGMNDDDKLAFLGKKMIANYGCNGCHAINGFETAASACTNLDDWGLKDPHKLDFGYFDHAFDENREKPIEVWKVAHEGLDSDAPQLQPMGAQIAQRSLKWEDIEGERRPWLYNKLHNTRVYDRGRESLESPYTNVDEAIKALDADVENVIGRPYDKLKMPKFFLTDEQVGALVTFVTSVRKPLVSEKIQQQTNTEQTLRLVHGREVATLYNCYGCHNIEGNQPHIWEYFDVHNADGSFNYENLNNAPPRLIGEGSRIQPGWLFYFLQDVYKLRPWLTIRMPSFFAADNPQAAEHVARIDDYFAVHTQGMSQKLAKWIDAIDASRALSPDDTDWFTRSKVAAPVAHLRAYTELIDLAKPREFDDRQSSIEDRRATWDRVLGQARFLRGTYDIQYPFVQTPRPKLDEERFARGEALYKELRCFQCHAMGDETTLQKLFDLDNKGKPAAAPAPEAPSSDDEYGDDSGSAKTTAKAAPKAEEKKADADEGDYGDESAKPAGDKAASGDEGYGEEAAAPAQPTGPVYSAPNLIYAAERLRWDWMHHWFIEPPTIQPGTKMPTWFPQEHSAFFQYPEAVKKKAEATYGYTGREQIELLMDFIYAAGQRNYTPGAERLYGQEPKKFEFKPLPPPVIEAPAPGRAATQPSAEQKPGAGMPAEEKPAESAKPAAPAVKPAANAPSTIELPEAAESPYAGDDKTPVKTRVVGVVKFDGKPPRREMVQMGSDPYCSTGQKSPVFVETLVVNKDQTLRYVLVHVKSGLPAGVKYEPPKTPVEIDQEGCHYVPHVIAAMTGQQIIFGNGDDTLHNLKFDSSNNGSFNEGMPVKGMEIKKTFGKVELTMPLKCNVHPWMNAVIHVLDNPYFCVSDNQGRFEIKGLPPGEYVLEALHEDPTVPPVTFKVTVKDGTATRADVTMMKP